MRLNVKTTSSALKSRVGLNQSRGLELDAVPQMKREGLGIGRLVPCLGEARHEIERSALEFDERVVDCVRAGVEVRAGGVLRGIEACRAAFRTEHQGFAGRVCRAGQGAEAQASSVQTAVRASLRAGEKRQAGRAGFDVACKVGKG